MGPAVAPDDDGAGGLAASGGVGGVAGASGAAGMMGSSDGASGLGAGGASGAGGGTAGGGGDAGSGDTDRSDAGVVVPGGAKPPCLTSPSQVVVVGDSYINYNENLNPRIAARAIADGALQEGEEYRMYAVPGASLASGGLTGFIPDQLAAAISDDPDIIAAIMTGGGNDLLLPDLFLGGAGCVDRADAASDPNCTNVVALALDKARELMLTAADAGVRDVIYFFYPHLPGGGLGGAHPNVILDYAYPLAEALCDDAALITGGELTCHFIDLRPVFDGQAWIQPDGVHPTAEGHEAMATEIYGVMKERCIAQPASSGCCEP